VWFRNSCRLIVEILHIVRSEHVAAEGDLVADTSKTQAVDFLPMSVPPKEKMKSREGCDEMLEKASTILTSSVATAASADDDKCRSFGSFFSNKLRKLFAAHQEPSVARNKQHHIRCRRGGFFMFYIQTPPLPVPNIACFIPHHSFLCCWYRKRKS
jgi:hypothetical protein